MNKIFIIILTSITILVFNSCNKENENLQSKALFNSGITYGTMTDIDENVYKTVTIGTQTWMAENLRTTKYNDGTVIPNVTSNQGWLTTTSGAYCIFSNSTSEQDIATYGNLYNWFAVKSDKLAPTGWHVPTIDDWNVLIKYLGGESVSGGKLKETTLWLNPNNGATNESGFTAVPAGIRQSTDGSFFGTGSFGYWWSNSLIDSGISPYSIKLEFSNSEIIILTGENKRSGMAIRCIKD